MNVNLKKTSKAISLILTPLLPLFITTQTQAIPAAPDLKISVVGNEVIINFDPVTNAKGYKLYYAGYPDISPIAFFDLKAETQLRVPLNELATFFTAISSYDDSGESPLSNIDIASLNEKLSGGDTTLNDASTHAFSSRP